MELWELSKLNLRPDKWAMCKIAKEKSNGFLKKCICAIDDNPKIARRYASKGIPVIRPMLEYITRKEYVDIIPTQLLERNDGINNCANKIIKNIVLSQK